MSLLKCCACQGALEQAQNKVNALQVTPKSNRSPMCCLFQGELDALRQQNQPAGEYSDTKCDAVLLESRVMELEKLLEAKTQSVSQHDADGKGTSTDAESKLVAAEKETLRLVGENSSLMQQVKQLQATLETQEHLQEKLNQEQMVTVKEQLQHSLQTPSFEDFYDGEVVAGYEAKIAELRQLLKEESGLSASLKSENLSLQQLLSNKITEQAAVQFTMDAAEQAHDDTVSGFEHTVHALREAVAEKSLMVDHLQQQLSSLDRNAVHQMEQRVEELEELLRDSMMHQESLAARDEEIDALKNALAQAQLQNGHLEELQATVTKLEARLGDSVVGQNVQDDRIDKNAMELDSTANDLLKLVKELQNSTLLCTTDLDSSLHDLIPTRGQNPIYDGAVSVQ